MYILYKFGSLVLPDRMPSDDHSTGEYATNPMPLSTGGAYDPNGDGQAKIVGAYDLSKRALFTFSDENEMKSFFNSLRALAGQKDRLYRRWDTGDIEWVTARLKAIEGVREIKNQSHMVADMLFEVYSHYWHGEFAGKWYFDDGHYFDTGLYFDSGGDNVVLSESPKSFTVTLEGDAIVNDPLIKVTAGVADITAIEIKNTASGHEAEIDYTGTISAGETLEIDCGEYSVENDGVDDEENMSLGTTHAINEWFRLAPGDNPIIVTITGGGNDSEIDFDYYVGWK